MIKTVQKIVPKIKKLETLPQRHKEMVTVQKIVPKIKKLETLPQRHKEMVTVQKIVPKIKKTTIYSIINGIINTIYSGF